MKPGDYPLRSSQSRAAARHVLSRRKVSEFEGILVRLVSAANPPELDEKCTCPRVAHGAFAICRCFIEAR